MIGDLARLRNVLCQGKTSVSLKVIAHGMNWMLPEAAVVVVGATRIVTVLDFLENANSIHIIVLRWLQQLLRQVQVYIFHRKTSNYNH